MGWDFTEGYTKADMVAELTKSWGSTTCLKYTVKGSTMWAVMETNGAKRIDCNLLKVDRKFGAGYKGMCESMGPCYYDCPLAYLDEVPAVNEEWRTKVRAFHELAAKRRAFAKLIVVGATVTISASYPVRTFKVTSLAPLVGVAEGREYRIPKNAIVAVS